MKHKTGKSPPKEKKIQRLQQLYEQIKQSLSVLPTHLLDNHLTIIDEQFKGRSIFVNMESLELVKVRVIYHEYKYDNTLEDRRNAIKTAKDIFEFYHEMQIRDYSKVSKCLHGVQLPTVPLYYRNISVQNCVVVEATMRYSFTDFLFNYGSLLDDLNARLNVLTQTIAIDNDNEGKQLRWEKEIPVSKQWWSH